MSVSHPDSYESKVRFFSPPTHLSCCLLSWPLVSRLILSFPILCCRLLLSQVRWCLAARCRSALRTGYVGTWPPSRSGSSPTSSSPTPRRCTTVSERWTWTASPSRTRWRPLPTWRSSTQVSSCMLMMGVFSCDVCRIQEIKRYYSETDETNWLSNIFSFLSWGLWVMMLLMLEYFQSQELSWGLRFLNKASNVLLWHRPKKI